MQLTYASDETNFVMPRGWIWNWQQGVSDIEGKVDFAINYVRGQRTRALVGGTSVPVPKHTTSREANPDSPDDGSAHVLPASQPMTMIGGDSVYGYPTATATASFFDTTTIPSGLGELIEVAEFIKACNGLTGGTT